MKTNEELQKDVQDAIKWEPLLNAAEIGVTSKDGIVTLTGVVDSYIKKLEAEDAAKKVAGVKAVVEKIEIKFDGAVKTGDNEIAKEVVNAFKWNWQIPEETVKVKVENGMVTLEGELQWNFQKDAARAAVSNLRGVKGVINRILLTSDSQDQVEKREIESALIRNWSINDKDIAVHVSGNNVTLNGKVKSYYQKEEAGRIAYNAPGVKTVENKLAIEFN